MIKYAAHVDINDDQFHYVDKKYKDTFRDAMLQFDEWDKKLPLHVKQERWIVEYDTEKKTKKRHEVYITMNEWLKINEEVLQSERVLTVFRKVLHDHRVSLLSPMRSLFLVTVAIAYNYLEETHCSAEYLARHFQCEKTRNLFVETLNLLTFKEKEMSYEEFIKRIVESNNFYAIVVKQADVTYLFNKAIKTDNKALIEKYKTIIPILFGNVDLL